MNALYALLLAAVFACGVGPASAQDTLPQPVELLPPVPPPAPPPWPQIRWKSIIPVCVIANPGLSPEADAEMRDMLPRAADVWNREANARIALRFSRDLNECANAEWPVEGNANPLPPVVPAFLMSDVLGFAAADSLGNTLGRGHGLHFATTYRWNDRICGVNGIAGPAKCRFGDAVHEFGHLLGFSHDHLSVNAPSCIDLKLTMETRGGMTYYDPKSIMNYCNDERWKGELSPADICSLRVAYPRQDFDELPESECYRLAAQAQAAAAPH